MKSIPLHLAPALVLALFVVPPHAQAERADRNLPMNVEADHLRYDDVRQSSVFTGRVVITQGSLVLRGSRVEIRQDAQGYQFGRVSAEPGARAFYRRKRDGVDEFIEGESESIEYDGRTDTVRLIGRAELRRLRGAQLADEITGSLIVFNNLDETFSVDGAPPGGGGGRVRAVLAPRTATPAPPTGGAQLRPSPQLPGASTTPAPGGERR